MIFIDLITLCTQGKNSYSENLAAEHIIGFNDIHLLIQGVQNFWIVKETLVDYFKNVILITEQDNFGENH